MESASGDFGDQTAERLVKKSVDLQPLAYVLKSFHAEEGTLLRNPMVLLEAIKANVDVGHEISSLAWSAVLRRQCQARGLGDADLGLRARGAQRGLR